jgi:hypothetical protein
MEQHSLLGNRFLISKYRRPLLGDTFADRHVHMEMIGITMEELCVFYMVRAEGL